MIITTTKITIVDNKYIFLISNTIYIIKLVYYNNTLITTVQIRNYSIMKFVQFVLLSSLFLLNSNIKSMIL